MTRKEFVEKLFGTKILTHYNDKVANKGCQGFYCPVEPWCENCKHAGFWNEVIDISNTAKTVLNILDGKNTIDNWVEVPSTLMGEDVNYIAEILDDATVHGLDFKYENGKFYFKDRQVSLNKDTQDVD